EGDGGEIGLVANQAVFGAVVQAVNVPSNAAFEVPLNLGDWQVEQFAVPSGVLEKFGDGFGGEAVGIKTVRQNTAERASPMPAADVAGGVQDGPVQKKLPLLPGLGAL